MVCLLDEVKMDISRIFYENFKQNLDEHKTL